MATSLTRRKVRKATKSGLATMRKAATALEKAASRYASVASKAGLAAKKKAKKMDKKKAGKMLGAVALAIAGYAAVKAARRSR